jgi:hypothetical protein
LLAGDGGKIVEDLVRSRDFAGCVIGITIENTFHIGWVGTGREDVAVKLFRRTWFVGKRLADDLGEDFCNAVIGSGLIPEAVRLSVMLFGVQQTCGGHGGDVLAVNPTKPSVTKLMTNHAFLT